MSSDPEETESAPTKLFVTPPTEVATENKLTIPAWITEPTVKASPALDVQQLAEKVDHLADQVGQVAYQADWLQRVIFPQENQPEQEVKQANALPFQPTAFEVAGGGLFFTMSATVSFSKEEVMGLVLLLVLVGAVCVFGYYTFRSAPAIS